jgi:hypothetical protein
VSRVVHSLFKEYIMRKIILAAAVAGAALSLSACSKTEAPPPRLNRLKPLPKPFRLTRPKPLLRRLPNLLGALALKITR